MKSKFIFFCILFPINCFANNEIKISCISLSNESNQFSAILNQSDHTILFINEDGNYFDEQETGINPGFIISFDNSDRFKFNNNQESRRIENIISFFCPPYSRSYAELYFHEMPNSINLKVKMTFSYSNENKILTERLPFECFRKE